MVYLNNIAESQVVFIPRNGMVADGNLKMTGKSTMDNSISFSAVVIDLETSTRYFFLAVTLPDGTPDGEYEYTLSDSKTTLCTGLMVIGESVGAKEYNKTIEYEQYNAE